MPRLFSYVVDHDLGFAPNPFGRFCTLAHCKFKTSNRSNIVELADIDDWVAGTGGLSSRSAGHGKLIYAMRVTEKLTLQDYYKDRRFYGRADNISGYASNTDRFVLISNDFFYFGDKAVDLNGIPARFLHHGFEKRGVGFRADFDELFISDFVQWLRKKFRRGVHSQPNAGRPSHAPKIICPKQPLAPTKTFAC